MSKTEAAVALLPYVLAAPAVIYAADWLAGLLLTLSREDD